MFVYNYRWHVNFPGARHSGLWKEVDTMELWTMLVGSVEQTVVVQSGN